MIGSHEKRSTDIAGCVDNLVSNTQVTARKSCRQRRRGICGVRAAFYGFPPFWESSHKDCHAQQAPLEIRPRGLL
jgi:hypothetical protein